MASARPPQQRTTWCGGCGAYLSVSPGARSVRCGLCHAVTRVERRPHGLHHAAVGFIKGLINAFTSPPQQQQQAPSAAAALQEPAASSFPRVRGCKKRALLVGISYAATKYELRGAVNDVNCMSYLLRERFGFPADCILVLTRGQGPWPGADAGEPAARAAVAGGRHQRRGLVGVPLLGPRRAEAGQGRRRSGRLRRGAVPRGLRGPRPRRRRDPGRRDQRHHRAAAGQGREAARHRGHLPQRHHPRPPLPLPPVQDRVLAVGEPTDPALRRDQQVHQRRPRHLHQRLRRQPDFAGHYGVLRVRLHRRHDVQLHQGGGIRAGHHLRPPADGDEGHHSRQRRGVRHTGPYRHLLPPGHHIQLCAGAPVVRFRNIRHLQETLSLVNLLLYIFDISSTPSHGTQE